MRIAVTGASGFVGRALLAYLTEHRYTVRALTRTVAASADRQACGVKTVVVGDLVQAEPARLEAALLGCDAVIHLAAKVHVMRPGPADAADFRKLNVDVTRRLGEAAVRAGVARFVFLSTIKVNGEATGRDDCFRPDDPIRPDGDYGRSKAEAEAALLAIEGLREPVILRPPLIYGPHVKGNFQALARLALGPWPLPLGGVRNRRSLIGINNLCSALEHLATAEGARVARQVFLVCDGKDVSTADLVRMMRAAGNRPARLVSVPARVLGGGLRALRLGSVATRLFGDLRIDDSTLRATGWIPCTTVEQEIERFVKAE